MLVLLTTRGSPFTMLLLCEFNGVPGVTGAYMAVGFGCCWGMGAGVTGVDVCFSVLFLCCSKSCAPFPEVALRPGLPSVSLSVITQADVLLSKTSR